MKKNYEELAIKVIRFVSEDVITASGVEPCREVICKDKFCRELVLPPCLDKECKYLGEPCPLNPCLDKCVM